MAETVRNQCSRCGANHEGPRQVCERELKTCPLCSRLNSEERDFCAGCGFTLLGVFSQKCLGKVSLLSSGFRVRSTDDHTLGGHGSGLAREKRSRR